MTTKSQKRELEVAKRLKARQKHESIQRAKFGEKLKKVNERLNKSIDVVVDRIVKQAKVNSLTAREMLSQIIESQLFADEYVTTESAPKPAQRALIAPRPNNVANVLEKSPGFDRSAWSPSKSETT